MEYTDSKGAMEILLIKSKTTLGRYEREGKVKAYRPFSNRRRYKISELHKLISKGSQ